MFCRAMRASCLRGSAGDARVANWARAFQYTHVDSCLALSMASMLVSTAFQSPWRKAARVFQASKSSFRSWLRVTLLK